MPADVNAAAEWQDRYDLGYPVLADPDAEIGEAYDQLSRYGVVGRLHNFLGRLPGAGLSTACK